MAQYRMPGFDELVDTYMRALLDARAAAGQLQTADDDGGDEREDGQDVARPDPVEVLPAYGAAGPPAGVGGTFDMHLLSDADADADADADTDDA